MYSAVGEIQRGRFRETRKLLATWASLKVFGAIVDLSGF